MLQNLADALRQSISSPHAVSEKMSEEMSEKEGAILQLLIAQPKMTASALASMLGVTSRTVERYLSALQSKGKVQRVGARKGGYWQVLR